MPIRNRRGGLRTALESPSRQPPASPVPASSRPVASAPLSSTAAKSLFTVGKPLNPLECPRLCEFNVEIQGTIKSGKSVLACGDPRCIYIKLPEGSTVLRRVRARVQTFQTLAELDTAFDEVCNYATKHGLDGDYDCVCIDSMRAWQNLLSIRNIARYNEQNAKTNGFIPIESVGEMGGYGTPYNQIVGPMNRWLAQINAVGWGYRTIVHYGEAVEYGDGGKPKSQKVWKARVFPSVAELVSPNADMILRCDNIVARGRPTQYIVDFSPEKSPHLASRIPLGLRGYCNILNYNDPETPPDYTAWDTVDAAYREAVAVWQKEQRSFHGEREGRGEKPELDAPSTGTGSR